MFCEQDRGSLTGLQTDHKQDDVYYKSPAQTYVVVCVVRKIASAGQATAIMT